MPRLSNAMRSRLVTEAAAALEGGTLTFYTGSAPATTDTAASGTALAALVFPAGGWNAAANGVVQMGDADFQAEATAAGTIGYARWVGDGAADERMDFSVTATGGGGDITVQNLSVAEGQPIIMTGFSLTQPAGAL